MDLGTIALLAAGLGAVYLVLSSGMEEPPADTGGDVGMPVDQGPIAGGEPMPADLESKVQQFAQAIAHAEGFGVPGAVPTVFHNPGDLGPGDCGSQYPSEFHGGSVVSKLPDDTTGWMLLTQKIRRAFNGQSGVYSPAMTIQQWANSYAGDSVNWARNVAAFLGVTPDTVIADWIAR